VATGAIGDSRSTKERGPGLVGSFGLVVPVQEIFFSLGSITKMFFLTVHYFNSFVPISQQDGQAVMPGRLSLNMYLCFHILRNVLYTNLHSLTISLQNKSATLYTEKYKYNVTYITGYTVSILILSVCLLNTYQYLHVIPNKQFCHLYSTFSILFSIKE
jgi:hypothetical protein